MGPTWIVLARDLSGTVDVEGDPAVRAVLILDADTGLIRGVSIADSIGQACRDAAGSALTQPAGSLPPGRPATVIYDLAHQAELLPALSEVLPGTTEATLLAEQPPAGAEDVFDSFIGHLAGRDQPTDVPEPEDWARLYQTAAEFCRSAPWQRWTANEPLPLFFDVEGQRTRYDAVVSGSDGDQRGLTLLPADPRTAASPVLWLDPPGELPEEFLAKALRYGWAPDAELAPLPAVLHLDGPADLDRASARQLIVALRAVAARPRPGP